MSTTGTPLMIGRRVRAARDRFGWNQAELAKRAGVRPNYLSRLESGSMGNPSADRLSLVASALGLKLTDLTDPPEPLDADLADMITRFGGGDRRVVAEALEELLRLPPEQRREAANWIVTSLQAIRRMRNGPV